jgi:uncharacterized repeat protein (TIGR02543 family)
MHAQWHDIAQPPPPQYTITFETHGGEPVPPAVKANEGTPVSQPATEPQKAGYSFAGWFSAASGGAKYPWPHPLAGDLTMHAQWTAIEYAVTYNNLGGGTNDPANPAQYTIESGEITLKNPARDNYDFGGWYANSDFTGGAVTGIPAGSTGAKTFYARWDPPASIGVMPLKPADDPALKEKTVDEDETFTFTVEGNYTAYQWYWDSKLIDSVTGNTYSRTTGGADVGIHELFVVVTGEGGKKLSARCKVTIKAKK